MRSPRKRGGSKRKKKGSSKTLDSFINDDKATSSRKEKTKMDTKTGDPPKKRSEKKTPDKGSKEKEGVEKNIPSNREIIEGNMGRKGGKKEGELKEDKTGSSDAGGGVRKEPVGPGSNLRKALDQKDAMSLIKSPVDGELSISGKDITAEEADVFLGPLKKTIEEKGATGIYFHTDMDGLNGALMIKDLIQHWFGYDFPFHASPIEHNEIPLLKIDDDICYIFVDITYPKRLENVFTIDHHGDRRDQKTIDEYIFMLSPLEKDYEYPSTATGLCAYLNYIGRGNRGSFFFFLGQGPWKDDPFIRLLMLLASVCDNLWHLNFLIDIPIKRWISDPEEERFLIKVSISASLMLGEEDRRNLVVNRFFKERVTPEGFLNLMCTYLDHAGNIFDFVVQISKAGEKFYNEIFFSLTDSIDRTLSAWDRDMEMLKKLNASMPIDLRGNREKMKELLKTRGDLSDEHWRRINFYNKELDKLESKIKVEEKTLLQLRGAKKLISTEKGPRLCVILPQQRSHQIKGITASLLYYMGWKNVVIEERKNEASWGARGFTRDQIGEQFNTLSMGHQELKDYLFMEKVFKDLPDVFRKGLNISKKIAFNQTYTGGMGGRGLIYGGTLTGKVPWIFSLLEETGDMEKKVKELMVHKELGNALQGLTEGQSTVSTAQALRAKFKSTGWVVVNLTGGAEGVDIMYGNFNQMIMHLVGYKESFQVTLKNIPRPLPNIEAGVFDGVVD